MKKYYVSYNFTTFFDGYGFGSIIEETNADINEETLSLWLKDINEKNNNKETVILNWKRID
jgi:hypothetical protein